MTPTALLHAALFKLAYATNAYGEEEASGARPDGDGWQQSGTRSGQPQWFRQAQRQDNGPYYSGDDAIQAKNQAVESMHTAPYANSDDGERAAGQQRSQDYQQLQQQSNRQLDGVNSQLDTTALRQLQIQNPQAYAQQIARIKQQHGYSPQTNTMRERNAIAPYSEQALASDRQRQTQAPAPVATRVTTRYADGRPTTASGWQPTQQQAQQRQVPQQPQRQYAQQPAPQQRQYAQQPQAAPQYRPSQVVKQMVSRQGYVQPQAYAPQRQPRFARGRR